MIKNQSKILLSINSLLKDKISKRLEKLNQDFHLFRAYKLTLSKINF